MNYKLHKRKTKKGISWHIISYKNYKAIYHETVGVVRKHEANRRLAEYNSGKVQNISTPKNLTLSEAFELWDEQYKNIVNKSETYRLFVGNKARIIEVIGNIPLKELTRINIDFLITQFKKRMKNRYINLHLVELSKLFQWLQDVDMLENPPKVKKLSETGRSKKTQIKTINQIQYVLDGLENYDLKVFIQTLKYTAMRPYEAIQLLWTDVDIVKNIITIRSENDHKPGGVIPLIGQLKFILMKYKDRSTSNKIFPWSTTRSPRDLMFQLSEKTGVKITPKTIKTSVFTHLSEQGMEFGHLLALSRHYDPKTLNEHYLSVRAQKTGEVLEKVI